ncbi:hypothetical protein MLP_41990 [Microlunatus phosphovorus NM-1]|uniref:Uncharacterized protein n=1 Tax=Microlunatus phosphovorus (strain ATCC 700054 / DSM 10555 / JCM 9379 / NBRC 101784 / NCIMB 13414 / VKM Ac-1990 / NM-1) TaxID=1032480 RepID=F5XS00_MICPN|nr:hypothetical protein MLP_41990 [Microlunatus phosphovorus NM-1]
MPSRCNWQPVPAGLPPTRIRSRTTSRGWRCCRPSTRPRWAGNSAPGISRTLRLRRSTPSATVGRPSGSTAGSSAPGPKTNRARSTCTTSNGLLPPAVTRSTPESPTSKQWWATPASQSASPATSTPGSSVDHWSSVALSRQLSRVEHRERSMANRLAPRGHERSAVRHAQQTAYAPGPQTIESQAQHPYGLRPRATNDQRSRGPSRRLAPRGHERSAVRHAQQTARAPGPQTIESQAQHPHGCRRRATNDRRSGAPSRRLAPPGHKRSKAEHNTRTAAAGGPRTIGGQARPADGLRPRATNDRKPSTTPARLPPAGHERPAVERAQRTACAPGPQTTISAAQRAFRRASASRLTLRATESGVRSAASDDSRRERPRRGAPGSVWTEERANTFFVCERRGKTEPIGA